MNTQLHEQVRPSAPALWPQNNTWLDSANEAQLRAYGESIGSRLRALNELQEHEARIARETADRIFERYPKVEKRIEGREKTERDLILILRYCGQAMLREDRDFLETQLLHWLRTMLVAYRFGSNCLRDSYLWLEELCRHSLSSESHYLLAPYLEDVIRVVPEGENRDEA